MSLTPTLDLIRNLSTESIAPSAPYIRDPELLASIAKEREAKTNALTEHLLANDSSYQGLLKSYLNQQAELLMARAENAKLAEAQNAERAYKEALAHSATEKINRKDPVGYAETINQLANNLSEEEAAYTNVARSLLEEPKFAEYPLPENILSFSLAPDPLTQLNNLSPETNNIIEEKIISNLADQVIRGKLGNGNERRKALGDYYSAVQAEVNKRMSQQPRSTPRRRKVKGSTNLYTEI